MTKKRVYTLHKERCQCSVRKSHTTKSGKTIILTGRHGFEWSIVETMGQNVKKTSYPNRESALRVYNHIIKMC